MRLEPVSCLFPHIFSADFAADCVKNPCHTTVCLWIFSLSLTKSCLQIRTQKDTKPALKTERSKADYERFAKEHRLGGILYFI